MSCSYICFTFSKTKGKEISKYRLSESVSGTIIMKTLILFLVGSLIGLTFANSVSEEKTCDDKPEEGVCDAFFPKWYYHKPTGRCYMFVYGGCGGNGNRYDTEQECLDSCQGE